MKKFLLFFLIILPSICTSQQYLWEKFYGSAKNDRAIETLNTDDKGLLIISDQYKNNMMDSLSFIRLDSSYNIRSVKYQPFKSIYGIVKNYDNTLTAVGGTSGPFLIKYDISGNKLWERKYTYWGENNWIHRINNLSDGSYVIRLWYESRQRNLYKLDAVGDTLWSLPIRPQHILPMQDSFIAIDNTYFRKYKNDGTLVYEKTLKLPFGVISVQPEKEGYLIIGSFTSTQTGTARIGLALINNNADTIWTGKYSHFSNSYARNVQRTADSGFLILSNSKIYNPFTSSDFNHLELIKVDKLGKMQWGKLLKSDSKDKTPVNMTLNCDSSIIVIGNTADGPKGGMDIIILKIDRLPNVFGPCGLPNSIPEDIQQVTDEIKIYPNPAIDQIHIQLKKELSGVLTIHNSLGQIVAHFNLNNAINIDIPFSIYAPGLYIITIANKQSGKIFKNKFVKR